MKRRWSSLAAILCMMLVASPVRAGSPSRADLAADLATVSNAFIRINVGPRGSAIMGTTGGDPDTLGDEGLSLLYGCWTPDSTSITGFTTIRVVSGGHTTDTRLHSVSPLDMPRTEAKSTISEWRLDAVSVEQIVSLSDNPFTGREDMGLWEITVTNTSGASIEAGIRLMLDLDIASNDYAPLLVPGYGRLNTEMDFGADLTHFRAFESDDYAEDGLRALGILRGYALTDPDRVVLASWSGGRGQGAGIVSTAWDYDVTPGALVGDSAMAYWWNPIPLGPGQSRTVRTQYGLGQGGGSTWFDAPNAVTCDDPAFEATLWVSNSSVDPLTNVQAVLTLPEGLSLASGDMTVTLPDVPADGASSATIELVADLTVVGELTYSAAVTYDGLAEPLTATGSIGVPPCATATPTASSTPTTTPTPTITPTPTSTPQPQSACWVSGDQDRILLIDADAFVAYSSDSASRSTLRHITEPPAPAGWRMPGFDMDAAWEPGVAVWWPEWAHSSWQPVPENATIIGIQRDRLPYGRDGVTQLVRREFDLAAPAEGWAVSSATLRTWSDNKAAWRWQGQCVLTDREGGGATVDLLPYTNPSGGHYTLAIQNSNDSSLPYGNPHGTAYELCVIWAWTGQIDRVSLPLIVR